MATYDGLFVRDAKGDTPNNPKNSNWTNSPDIICSGPTPLKDPKSIVDVNNYNNGLPFLNSQSPLQNNWVYVRAINSVDKSQQSTIYLYYVDTSIVLWPQNWKYLGITYEGTENQYWAQVAAEGTSSPSKGITGTIVPFGWTPPKKGQHYCLAAWVNNGPDQDTPPNLFAIGSVSDMGKFIMEHPNVGWKNTVEVDAAVPTTQNYANIEGPANGGIITIGVQCDNLPTDGYIEFSVPGPDEKNTIIFQKAPILYPNYAPSLKVTYPPGFKTQMTFTYYQGKNPAPDGSNLVPMVGDTSKKLIEEAEIRAPHMVADVHHYGTPEEYAAMLANGDLGGPVPPTKVVIVGTIPFRLTDMKLKAERLKGLLQES